MSDNVKSNIGYFVAGFGAIIMLVTLWLLHTGALPITDSKSILIMLIIVSALLIAMGMYVVVPKEAHDAVTDLGGAAKDLLPYRFARQRTDDTTAQPPVAVQPAPGQSAVVQSPAGPSVEVSPEGDVTVNQEPESSGVMPLAGARPVLQRPGKIGSATVQRQTLYPHDEA